MAVASEKAIVFHRAQRRESGVGMEEEASQDSQMILALERR